MTFHYYGLGYFQIKSEFENVRRIDEINLCMNVFHNKDVLIAHCTFQNLCTFLVENVFQVMLYLVFLVTNPF